MPIRWTTLFLDRPGPEFAAARDFWTAVTGSTLSPVRGPEGEFVTLLPPSGDAYVRLQRIRDGAGGQHLDLHVDDLPGTAQRAGDLGARRLHAEDGLMVLESPGGFGFCLVGRDGESVVPRPFSGPGGTDRLDQLCLDVPPGLFDAECAFWAALTGWPLRTGSRPEFAVLERPPGIPVRLMLQRRAEAAPGERVTAHLDLATSDRARLAEVHARAGARVQARFPHWTTLTDPSGHPYCLTARDPATGLLPPG